MIDAIIRLINILLWVICAAICFVALAHGYWITVIIFVLCLIGATWWFSD
jgi:hypothetical protein